MDREEEIEKKLYNLRKFRKDDDVEPSPYHFRDGIRRVHYVIVLHDSSIYKKDTLSRILDFLSFLEFQGLELEFEIGLMDSSLVYLKVHAADHIIKQFANVYDIDIENSGHNFVPDDSRRFHFRMTELTREHEDVFKRKKRQPTSCEIIVLLSKILSDPLTYDEKDVYSIEKMLKLGYIKDAFALHDGPWQWTEGKQENLNDRQVLSKYWANYMMWYKEQPINLVAKYFGTDMAFYFAWCEHYNMMLIVVALVGIIIVMLNCFILWFRPPVIIADICTATDMMMCPMCIEKNCHFVPLSYYCKTSSAELVLGNYLNVIYAVVISIWVTVFLESWRRKECTLKVRWNVQYADVEYNIRYDYKDKSTYLKKSKITGKIEPYVPPGVTILRYGFTYLIVLLVVVIVSTYVILLILLKNWLTTLMAYKLEPTPTLSSTVIYSIFQVIFIKILSMFNIKFAIWLTDIEVPKTQKQYDDSVIYKIYAFGFINNYIPILYTAFLRGKLFKTPGEVSSSDIFEQDICLPTGCIILLAIQLFVVMALKTMGGNIFSAVGRCIRGMLFTASQTKTVSATKMYIPTWEKEYYLEKSGNEYWAFEFSEMILQFGYVSFFMAAFPLVGFIALLNNVAEFRLDAVNLIRSHRRPVPKMIKGIGAWDDILKFASYFSIVCNAFIVAFNTNSITSMAYRFLYQNGTEGLRDFVFSKYAVSDLPEGHQNMKKNITECWYPGFRYPPDDVHKYETTDVHYLLVVWKFVFVILFENVILIIIGGIYYFVDEMPRRVKEQLHKERLFTKEVKMKMLESKMHITKALKSQENEASLDE